MDALLEAIAEIETLAARDREVFEMATGVFVNDPVFTSVVAMVWKGRLAHLDLDDHVSKLPTGEAAELINGVIIGAFLAYHEEVVGRLQAR